MDGLGGYAHKVKDEHSLNLHIASKIVTNTSHQDQCNRFD